MNRRPSRSTQLVTVAAALATGAVACRLAFHLIGSHVDASGVLREPFALLPLSALLFLASAACLARAWAVRSHKP